MPVAVTHSGCPHEGYTMRNPETRPEERPGNTHTTDANGSLQRSGQNALLNHLWNMTGTYHRIPLIASSDRQLTSYLRIKAVRLFATPNTTATSSEAPAPDRPGSSSM